MLAAADGVVQWVRTDDQGCETISTYLNLLDVHVTRAPCDATVIEQTTAVDGTVRPSAPLPTRTREWSGARYRARHRRLTQFAGTVARRIVVHRSTGDVLRRGEPIGLIRFGSRVDVDLPPGLARL